MARKIGADCEAGEENKMAEIEVKELEVKERKRKPNFSPLEISVITESVKKNIDVIQSKLTNNITNKRKSQVWDEITKEVNAVGRANRSIQEIKDKWKNLHSTAKKEFSNYKKEYKKTGGGPSPKPPSQSSEQIIEIFETHQPSQDWGDLRLVAAKGLFKFLLLNAQHFLELNIVEPAEADIVEDQQDLPTLSSEDMMKLGLIAQVKEDHSLLPPNRKRRISQADILAEQQKALKLQQEMLELKKTKL
ncbi:t-SNARE domain-containing protein 1-like [Montipora foliosa]|uniref:t-SNARE domain-containing protein 1-like n=1 Tax=Montipora foliosa TaxID=591990 RepID=UPI0035F1AB52